MLPKQQHNLDCNNLKLDTLVHNRMGLGHALHLPFCYI
jgi:hypothetical protein